MKDYRTSSSSFREYLKINNIAWEDCEVEILMESIYETPVREYEQTLNCVDFKDDYLCWSSGTTSRDFGCLEKLYNSCNKQSGYLLEEYHKTPEQMIDGILHLSKINKPFLKDILEDLKREEQKMSQKKIHPYKILRLQTKINSLETCLGYRSKPKKEKTALSEMKDWYPTADFT